MKESINFIETNVNGKTLFTKKFVYKLKNGAESTAFAAALAPF